MKNFSFLGINIESGQGHKGLRDSANYARDFFEKKYQFQDLGNIVESVNYKPIHWLKNLSSEQTAPYTEAHQRIQNALIEENFHLNWGGDHSVGLSTVSAFKQVYPDGVVVWIDAHADLNIPESSVTGNLHGMPISFLLGLNNKNFCKEIEDVLRPQDIIYIGLRSLDFFEEEVIGSLGISHFDMGYIRRNGILKVLELVGKKIGGKPIHVSFDIDSVDPSLAPATGVPVSGGLNWDEMESIAYFFAAQKNLKSLDVVEFNPTLGSPADIEKTFQVAHGFVSPFIKKYEKKKTEVLDLQCIDDIGFQGRGLGVRRIPFNDLAIFTD
jgi:arginase